MSEQAQDCKVLRVGESVMACRHARDEQIAKEVCAKQVYRRPRLGFTVKPGERWLDLGGNIGAFAIWAARIGAQVTTVEACKANVDMIDHNLRLNGLFAEVIHGFASNTGSGTTRVIYNSATPGRSGKWASETKHTAVEEVPNVDIPKLVASGKFDGVKIDIEGGEFAILDHPKMRWKGVSKVALEYHYRFDKSCANARRRIAPLLERFKRRSVSKQTLEGDEWGGWVDEVMLFWGPHK